MGRGGTKGVTQAGKEYFTIQSYQTESLNYPNHRTGRDVGGCLIQHPVQWQEALHHPGKMIFQSLLENSSMFTNV